MFTCGTHLGDTKLVVSITGSPASDSRSIRPIFTDVGRICYNMQKHGVIYYTIIQQQLHVANYKQYE